MTTKPPSGKIEEWAGQNPHEYIKEKIGKECFMGMIPCKTIIYGISGVGKSTLASKFPKPYFFDTENGLRFIDGVASVRVNEFKDFVEKMNLFLRAVANQPGKYETIVIDSADWLMTMLNEDVAGSGGKTMQERLLNASNTVGGANGGYAKGYEHARNLTYSLLNTLNKIVDMGISLVLIAHAVKTEQMTSEGYTEEIVSPKIDKKNLDLFLEWVDNIFYLMLDGDKRKLIVSPSEAILAKNRLGLSGEIELTDDFNFEEILTKKDKKENKK